MENSVVYRSRSALTVIIGIQACIQAEGTISDWRVAQETIAIKLARLGYAVDNRYDRDQGIDVIAIGANRLVIQVKSQARGIGPGAVRDFATAVAAIREQIGTCTALMVSTVGRPTEGALAWAAVMGSSVCTTVISTGGWRRMFLRKRSRRSKWLTTAQQIPLSGSI
jgi:Restriction endonuclease